MINIVYKENCCGCSSCATVCPKQCIAMEVDSEGFLYPLVDQDVCISCGLCKKCCPILQEKKNSSYIEKAFVGYAKDEDIRMRSSSGGLFSIIARKVLSENGVVYGAAFDNDFTVHHIGINSLIDLEKLRGSKYVQSRIENTYCEVKKVLDQGKRVLFSGTACQIAGLKASLRKDYENLILVDILCHGTPSPKVWKKYLEEKEKQYNSKIKKIRFRDKESGWKTYSVTKTFENNKTQKTAFSQDSYMRMFLSEICLRPSCHSCRFKNLKRSSDITIGDCWGIENYMPDMDDNKGTSVIIVHSVKGESMIHSIEEQLNIKIAEVDKALPPTADSRKSVVANPKRSKFFKKLNNNVSIDELLKLTKISFLRRCIRKMRRLFRIIIKKFLA